MSEKEYNNNITPETIIEEPIHSEVESSYISYALSTIISRALPDVRDGLKPVHRRILYSMWEQGITFEKTTKKCARIVGDVLGKYHPHGDKAVYDSLVRLAQDFSLRYPLIFGQGNFGSIDGDNPAAMRYTEAKLNKITEKLLEDLDKEIVNFIPNFDNSMKEPEVLPANFPNILVNGSDGIAVGLTTGIPPHNLSEVIDALIYLIDNPEAEIEDLMNYIKGPDYPTAGYVIRDQNFYEVYKSGKGIIAVRGKAKIERQKKENYIIIEELPYLVNKAKLIEKIVELVKSGVLYGITDLRDESNRDGIRIVIKVKNNFNPEVILQKLFKHTELQRTYSIRFIAIKDAQPKSYNLKTILKEYYEFKKEIVVKRFQFLLKKAEEKSHLLEGLIKALNIIDKVIDTIKNSKDTKSAKSNLMKNYEFSEKQAQAILEMRLQRLTSLEINKIKDEFDKLQKEIKRIKNILSTPENIDKQIKKELKEVKDKFGDERKTGFVNVEDINDVIPEVIKEEVFVIFTKKGFIKSVRKDKFSIQNIGGRGKRGIKVEEDDMVTDIIRCFTTDNILFFTNKGKAYSMLVNDIRIESLTSKGEHISTKINLSENEHVKNIEIIKDFEEKEKFITLVTKSGIIKRIELRAIRNCKNRNGLIYAKIKDNDEIVDSVIVKQNDTLLIGTAKGKGIRFKVSDVRAMGRNATGVYGIRPNKDDHVVAMIKIIPEKKILIATENGYGKMVKPEQFPIHRRGGKGVCIVSNLKKAGKVVAIKNVSPEEQLLCISSDGNTIKFYGKDINIQNRCSLGKRIIKLKGNARLASIAVVNEKKF